MSRPEALTVIKACCARLYSDSRLKKREPLIALGSHQGVLNFCIRSTPLRLKEAVERVRKGDISQKKAAKFHSIPVLTLSDNVHEKVYKANKIIVQ